MHIMNQLVTVSIVAMTVGCATTSEPPPLVTQVQYQPSNQKGFSLTFTGKESWTVNEETPYKVVYSKQNTNNSERHLIQALVVKLPSFNNDQEFLEFVEKSIEKNRQKSKLKLLQQQVGFSSTQGEKCVRYNSMEEPAAKSKVAKPVVLGMVNYTCRHPDKANTGIYMAYSVKSLADKSDENIIANAENIFSSLSFNKF